MINKIFFLGFTLPQNMIDELLRHEKSMPIQTLSFANNFRASLESNDSHVILASTYPVTNYPNNSNIFFGFKNFNIDSSLGFTIPFINIIGLKHLSRLISGYTLLKSRLSLCNIDNTAIIIHGIHSPFLLIGFILRKLYGIKVICIVTDPPSDISKYPTLERIMRVIDKKLIFHFLRNIDGIITLSELFIKDHSLKVPYIVLDGFCDTNSSHSLENSLSNKIKNHRKFKFAYAGGLNEEYGVKMLVEAALLTPNIELHLYGKGPLDNYLADVSIKHKNIFYNGFMHPKDLKIELSKKDCLVNPRPSNQSFVRYSFPSKLLEYMSLGVPVLTTKLPSLSVDYYPYIFTINDETVIGISNALERVSTQKKQSLTVKAKKAKEFVLSTRSISAQGKKIKTFINSL